MAQQIGFLFPGQGSQSVGMGFSLASKSPDFEAIFLETLREADATLGFALSEIIRNGPSEKLKQTEITQPALLSVSTAMGRWLKSKGTSAAAVLGHSLGEYSALVHSDAISFSQAIKIVHLRGQLMQSAVPRGEGGMAALLGANPELAQKICESISSSLPGCVLETSAFNAPGQIVLSGSMKAIDSVVARAKELGARGAIKLEVSGPFHCSLLKNAGKKLGEALGSIDITEPKCEVIANTTALPVKTSSQILKVLEEQVYRAVRWEDSLRYVAQKLGIKEFIEVGSGKVLSGLVKKTLPDAMCTTLD